MSAWNSADFSVAVVGIVAGVDSAAAADSAVFVAVKWRVFLLTLAVVGVVAGLMVAIYGE